MDEAAVVPAAKTELPEWAVGFEGADFGNDRGGIETVASRFGQAFDGEEIAAEHGMDVEEFAEHTFGAFGRHRGVWFSGSHGFGSIRGWLKYACA